METLPIIAETGQALGLPLTVTLAIVIIATFVIGVIVLRDHRTKIDHNQEAVASMKSEMSQQIAEIKAYAEKEISTVRVSMEKTIDEMKIDMAKQAAAHNAELSSLYKLINGVAIDVSFIKGKMTRGQK